MLNNTIYKLKNEKKLTLGFFGGSVTDGTGASDAEKTSYRALVSEWFRKTYPEAEITSFNASIGGTGTGYGAFRCDRDLLSHGPDLVFIEYCGNDWGDSYDNVLPQAETIIRKIRKKRPDADVITVFDMYTDVAKDLEKVHEHEARSAMATAAHRYGATVIDAGTVLLIRILRDGGDFEKYIPDGGHPNDLGYKVLADAIISRLKESLDDTSGPVTGIIPWEIPAPVSDRVLDNARMVTPQEITGLKPGNFEIKGTGNDGQFPGYLEGFPGDSFEFDFSGDVLGFIWDLSCSNSDVDVTIDGNGPVRVRSWDCAVRSFDRFRAALFMRDLDPSVIHHAYVRVCGDREYGGIERICAILLD